MLQPSLGVSSLDLGRPTRAASFLARDRPSEIEAKVAYDFSKLERLLPAPKQEEGEAGETE